MVIQGVIRISNEDEKWRKKSNGENDQAHKWEKFVKKWGKF